MKNIITRAEIIEIIQAVDQELNSDTESKILEHLSPRKQQYLIRTGTGESLEQLINECRGIKIDKISLKYLLESDFESDEVNKNRSK